jgi:hypothetical protein
MGTGGALVGDQAVDVCGIFDLRAFVEAAGMGGDDGAGIDDAYRGERCQHDHSALDMCMGERVVVQIEAHVGRLADADL